MTAAVNNSTRLTGWYSDPQRLGHLLWWNGSAFERDGRATALSFKEAIREGLTDWSFSGRASRSAYWFFSLFTILVAVVPVLILRIVVWLIGNEGQGGLSESAAARAVLMTASLAQAVALVLCSVILLKLWVKRMHDRGIGGPARLGGRVLVYCIPYTVLYLSSHGVFFLSNQAETYVQLLLVAATLWAVVELCLPGHRHINKYNVEASITPQ